MSQQLQIKSPEKRRLASPSPQPVPARSFQGKLPSPILQLQRTLGNRRVAQLIRARCLTPQGKIIGLQRKLTVGAADDQYEHEADHVARQVMNMPNAVSANPMKPALSEDTVEEDKEQMLQTKSLAASITPFVQRQTVSEEEEENKTIQARAIGSLTDSFEAGADVKSQLDRSKGCGSPLPDSVRAFMEPRFGVDFGQVLTHTGSEAVQMNREVGAKAFTHGTDIYYGAGNSPANLELTAHELTHVVQQTGSMPLQPKRLDKSSSADIAPSIQQKSCAACAADTRKEKGSDRSDPISHDTLRLAPAEAPPDKELMSPLFAGNADLKEVLNRRKVLINGNSGDAVKLIQEALLAEGYDLPKFGVDGKFGDETAKAVKEFQRRWRMSVDGIVGDKTLGLLDIHLVAKKVLAVGESLPLIGGLVKEAAASVLDVAEKERRKIGCPAADKAERLTACIELVIIANDDGSSPTSAPSMALAQRIWEKCCVNLSVLSTKTVNKTDFKTLDESPTNVPTAEESALFAEAGSSSCIQVFVPENFAQGGTVGKAISGGGATYDGGTANPKVVVVEGTVSAVVAHEIGHALGHSGHDAADTVMKPTGAHNVPNSPKVSRPVCTEARTGVALSTTSGKDDCCMFPA